MKFRLSRLFRKPKERIIPRAHIKINEDGTYEIIGLGAWHSYWRDPYHLMLTIPWSLFILLLCTIYIGINCFFTLLFWLGGDCIANTKPGSFLDIFFFSVQTLASIGYGLMYPKSVYSNTIVTIEAIVGVMGVAVMTGLAFARFSQPTARVLFSRVATVANHDGALTLIFRTANQRRNAILEAQVRVYLMRDEITLEGQVMRRLHDLKLVRNQTPSFALSWSVMHVIDESSPLYGATSEVLQENGSLLIVSLSGTDETVNQTVHSRHVYSANQILWNTRFVNIMHNTNDEHRYIDYKHFHDVLPIG
jgi:inward rectifier potassium channel